MKEPCFKRQGFYFNTIYRQFFLKIKTRQKSRRLPTRLERINKVDSTFAPSKIYHQVNKSLRYKNRIHSTIKKNGDFKIS